MCVLFKLYVERIIVFFVYLCPIMIDKDTIQRIMDATDIVEVVREFVDLRKAGTGYKGLCPFHNEKTPSFNVSPAKQYCKCFSCGKGGNAVHFLMELEQMTYPEALKWLGRKYGIEVKEKELTDEERTQQSERESMFIVNEWANNYFQTILHENVDGVAKGMAYFRSRGFRDDIIRKFQLGYSLEQRDAMTQAALSAGYKENFLLATGLSYRTDDGRVLDRYHGRVIFPVSSVSGKTVAFGGRILSSEKQLAKYVNSPESIIYSKSHELYGLYQAKQSIVREGRCFLVEGYTDVISMHQSGVENVVASSGTSLTEGQIRLIHRFTENITVLYDGDSAGIKASLRGIDMLLSEGLNIKVLLLPDGHDPDSFARSHNAQAFKDYIDAHQVDFIKFKVDLLQKEAEGDPLKRAELISNVVKSISVIPNNIVRQMYVKECATMLHVGEELIVNEINKLHKAGLHKEGQKEVQASDGKSNDGDGSQSPTPSFVTKTENAEERALTTMIIRYGGCPVRCATDDDSSNKTMPLAVYVKHCLEADDIMFTTPLYERILQEAYNKAEAEETWESLPFFLRHVDSEICALASELAEDKFELSTEQRKQYTSDEYRLEEIIPRMLNDYKHSIVKGHVNSLLQQMRNPEVMNDPERSRTLMKQYMEASAVERQFARVLGDRVIQPKR